MQTGDARLLKRAFTRVSMRGFTYLWLMFVLAIGAAMLATAASRISNVTARERERELIYRGTQIAAAIAAYHGAAPVAAGQVVAFEDLVDDRRFNPVRHHLRRAYPDPFTGRRDWIESRDALGRWQGVSSRSKAPALLTSAPSMTVAAGQSARVADHRFIVELPMPRASSPDARGARATSNRNP